MADSRGKGGLSVGYYSDQQAIIEYRASKIQEAGFNIIAPDLTNVVHEIFTDPIYTSDIHIKADQLFASIPEERGVRNVILPDLFSTNLSVVANYLVDGVWARKDFLRPHFLMNDNWFSHHCSS